MTALPAAPNVPIAVRRYLLRAVGEVHLPPFAGSTVRGAVGRALRRLVCATKLPACAGCPVRSACAYAMLHDGYTPAGTANGTGEHAPPPLWLRDLPEGRRLAAGETAAFSVVAFGPAVSALPYVDEAVRGLSRSGLGRGRGGIELVEARDERRDGVAALIEERVAALEQGLAGGRALRVVMRTPVAIRLKGRAWEDPARPRPSWAERLLGGAVRRRTALERRWLNLAADEAPRLGRVVDAAAGLSVLSEQVRPRRVQRFSSSQGGRVELHGMVGEVQLGGEGLGAALPWLAAGELLSVGSGTTFGFGRIDLEAA